MIFLFLVDVSVSLTLALVTSVCISNGRNGNFRNMYDTTQALVDSRHFINSSWNRKIINMANDWNRKIISCQLLNNIVKDLIRKIITHS